MPGSKVTLNSRAQTTHFLNVDLDIYSRTRLEPLFAALGEDIIVLHEGRQGSRYSAHLELLPPPKTAGAAICGLCTLIRALPSPARRHWDRATKRVFNIGIQAARKDQPFEIDLKPETVRGVSSLNARIVVTVYAPTLVPCLTKR